MANTKLTAPFYTRLAMVLISLIALFITMVVSEWIVRRRGRPDRGGNSAIG